MRGQDDTNVTGCSDDEMDEDEAAKRLIRQVIVTSGDQVKIHYRNDMNILTIIFLMQSPPIVCFSLKKIKLPTRFSFASSYLNDDISFSVYHIICISFLGGNIAKCML